MIDVRKLIGEVRNLSGQRESDFQYDSEIVEAINSGVELIYNDVAQLDENFFLEEPLDLQIAEGTENVIDLEQGLPEGRALLRIRSLIAYKGNCPYPLVPISIEGLADNDQFEYDFYYGNDNACAYVLEASKIRIYPRDRAKSITRYRLRYVLESPDAPSEPESSEEPWILDLKTIKSIYNYIKYYAASDVSDIQQLKNKWAAKATYWHKMIMEWADNRDTSYNKTMRKVRKPKRIGISYGVY